MPEARTAIVTGGARGIGLACARRLLADGWRVVIADVDEDQGRKVTHDLDASGERALFVGCDVSDKLDIHNVLAETLSAFDTVEGLVNNAGIIAAGTILDLDPADFDKVLSINLRGMFMMEQTVARQMVQQITDQELRSEQVRRRYGIVNMASVNAVTAMAGQLAYNISKGGVLQLTRSSALALAPFGIRVNAVGPGSVNTDMLGAVVNDKDAMRGVLSRTPLGRIGDPDEVASVVSFLMSEDASYVTGETLYADGGRLALNMTV